MDLRGSNGADLLLTTLLPRQSTSEVDGRLQLHPLEDRCLNFPLHLETRLLHPPRGRCHPIYFVNKRQKNWKLRFSSKNYLRYSVSIAPRTADGPTAISSRKNSETTITITGLTQWPTKLCKCTHHLHNEARARAPSNPLTGVPAVQICVILSEFEISTSGSASKSKISARIPGSMTPRSVRLK